MEKTTFNRIEIYELVWKEPLSVLAKTYLMSDNGFRKLCKRLNIPIPKNGHWQKVKFNKPIKIEKLPADFIGNETVELQLRGEGTEWNDDQTPLTILSKQIKNDPKAPTTVPERLDKPDKLTSNTKTYWALPERDRYDRGKKIETLPISVEKNNRARALLFMDTLVKLLKYRGYEIVQENGETKVEIRGIRIPFRLREATKRVPSSDKWRTADYVPTGEFILKTGQWSSDKEWRDSKIKLEDQLPKILAKLELDAEKEKLQKEESRKFRESFEAEQRKMEEAKKRREDELKNFNQLLKTSERYDKVIALRNYIKAVKENAKSKNALTQELIEWISWAKDKADWYDPMINKEDEFLNDAHK
jgi:hypothetical protein